MHGPQSPSAHRESTGFCRAAPGPNCAGCAPCPGGQSIGVMRCRRTALERRVTGWFEPSRLGGHPYVHGRLMVRLIEKRDRRSWLTPERVAHRGSRRFHLRMRDNGSEAGDRVTENVPEGSVGRDFNGTTPIEEEDGIVDQRRPVVGADAGTVVERG